LNFVTAKVVKGALDIKHGKKKTLELGNLEAKRDWGHAADFVYAMWLMIQQKKPVDYVVATGEEHSVRELCDYVFKKVGLGDYKKYVRSSTRYLRPYELFQLKGDPTKIKRELGWKPKIGFEELLDEMIVEIEKEFYPSA